MGETREEHLQRLDDAAEEAEKAQEDGKKTGTIWDYYGEITLHKGERMGNDCELSWRIAELGPGETVSVWGTKDLCARGWGLDQAHLQVEVEGLMVLDVPEAGVFCPP